ncbi:hypothetical protein [Burkholderia gladioli]|uniref:hypothetical protein n=1 Tax=Burkholderia gladioli TaxID=28095 RepID=UPI00164078F1|nr:hypothetical protein [Burkholderia gladioli]
MKIIRYLKFICLAILFFSIGERSFSQGLGEKQNALIEVSVNGVVYKGEAEMEAAGITDSILAMQFIERNSIFVPRGGSIKVKLELVTGDGRRKDITSDPCLYMLNVADWAFQWARGGTITQEPNPLYSGDRNLMNARLGQIMFVYHHDGIFGYNRIFLKTQDE